MVLYIEMGLITPPVGLNLFVISGLSPENKMRDIVKGAVPYFLILIVVLAILTKFPQIALWLPAQMA